MTNPNDPAFSAEGAGLTIREHFAALAMQGLANSDLGFGTVGNPCSPWPWVAEQAVAAADALITELNKEPPK